MTEAIQLTPTKSDTEKAQDYKAEITPVLEQACRIISSARREGLDINFALGPDQFGVQRIQMLTITKSLL